jgi:DNA-binding transcriptional regulator GbsR (MarR family)
MKAFKNVSEWLASNPSEETVNKVMNVINHAAIKELKQELRDKENKLKKVERLHKSTQALGLETKTSKDYINALTKEVEALRKQIPEEIKKEIVEKPKEETKQSK